MNKSEFYRDARRDLTGPLDGVRVIDATTSWAGPMCACMLADLGADVVKVEAREGEVARRIPPSLPGHDVPVGFAQATVNRNKRSLTLDLRRPEGRDIFLKLATRSDIIVQNCTALSTNGASATSRFAPLSRISFTFRSAASASSVPYTIAWRTIRLRKRWVDSFRSTAAPTAHR